MDIYGIESGASVTMVRDATRNRWDTAAETTASGDTVSISQEAWDLAHARNQETVKPLGDAARSGESGSQEAYPVEAYSIPGWYVDLFGGYNSLQAELGVSYEQARTGYDKLSTGEQKAFDEYAGILDTYFHEELERIGVSGDTGKYYNDFILNSANQSSVREAIHARIENNPRALELMQSFDIAI